MQTSNVSEPILSNSQGWFRYNYDENQLEFINQNTKLVTHKWCIPADQWDALPSQKEYCENIIQQAENGRSRLLTQAIVSAIIAAVSWYLTPLMDIFSVLAPVATVVAVFSFVRWYKG